MDAIMKKMQSLKTETDQLLQQITVWEEDAKAADKISEQCELDTR